MVLWDILLVYITKRLFSIRYPISCGFAIKNDYYFSLLIHLFCTLFLSFFYFVSFSEISDSADWQKRYCVLAKEERKLYFYIDQEVSSSLKSLQLKYNKWIIEGVPNKINTER